MTSAVGFCGFALLTTETHICKVIRELFRVPLFAIERRKFFKSELVLHDKNVCLDFGLEILMYQTILFWFAEVSNSVNRACRSRSGFLIFMNLQIVSGQILCGQYYLGSLLLQWELSIVHEHTHTHAHTHTNTRTHTHTHTPA